MQADDTLEAGECRSITLDNLILREAFLHKVYLTLTLQVFLTIATVVTVFVSIHPIAVISSPSTGLAFHLLSTITPFIGLALLYNCRKESLANYLLLFAFTIAVSILVAFTCVYFISAGRISTWKVMLEAAVVTIVVFVSLTCYALKAASRGQDFSFLELFLLAAIIVLMVLLSLQLLQVLFPSGRISVIFLGSLASTIYYGYIVYVTHDLEKRFSYDEHIWASLSLYLYIICLFLFLLTVFIASHG